MWLVSGVDGGISLRSLHALRLDSRPVVAYPLPFEMTDVIFPLGYDVIRKVLKYTRIGILYVLKQLKELY